MSSKLVGMLIFLLQVVSKIFIGAVGDIFLFTSGNHLTRDRQTLGNPLRQTTV